MTRAALTDEQRMREALALAERGWGQTSPNPLVGAVVYANDTKVGEGYHAMLGAPHAEAVALDMAGSSAAGSTLYVTLQPCAHVGRTPPCADKIIASRVARVVIATRDPNPIAAGGLEKLRDAGILVNTGILETEARELNAAFLHSFVSDRPWVTLKLAVSLDSAIAGAERNREQLTGALANEVVHRIRASNDAIAVGVKTASIDDPQLTVRGPVVPRIPPLRIVFDGNARLAAESHLAQTARQVPTLIIASNTTRLPDNLRELGVEMMTAHDLDEALRKLKDRGVRSLLVEGGAGLAASFLAAGAVDRLILFQTPVILGDGALGAFSGVAHQPLSRAPRFRLVKTKALGDDIMTTYAPAET